MVKRCELATISFRQIIKFLVGDGSCASSSGEKRPVALDYFREIPFSLPSPEVGAGRRRIRTDKTCLWRSMGLHFGPAPLPKGDRFGRVTLASLSAISGALGPSRCKGFLERGLTSAPSVRLATTTLRVTHLKRRPATLTPRRPRLSPPNLPKDERRKSTGVPKSLQRNSTSRIPSPEVDS